ncbi:MULTISPECIES: hypothetical protein [Streptacidiphilus]|uniref:DUF2892 domain-containing protein n=1 Tax=Streptacidiphilus cavernicola TaxID=3342716 RepID=A0ABV6UTQ3_9ACTN|nr:hypothetical protein [Streptacidiphilus jeojiense]
MNRGEIRSVLLRIRREAALGLVLYPVWHFIGGHSWTASLWMAGVYAVAGICVECLLIRFPGMRFEARQAKRLARRGRHQ